MGFLTDVWNQISEFLGIELVEPIVPEAPPKPYEPKETETPLPERTEAIAPVEEIEPLPILDIIARTPIGEQGRADRITVLPAKEEPELPKPDERDVTVTQGSTGQTYLGKTIWWIDFYIYNGKPNEFAKVYVKGADETEYDYIGGITLNASGTNHYKVNVPEDWKNNSLTRGFSTKAIGES